MKIKKYNADKVGKFAMRASVCQKVGPGEPSMILSVRVDAMTFLLCLINLPQSFLVYVIFS